MEDYRKRPYKAPSKTIFYANLIAFIIAMIILWINYYFHDKAMHGSAYPWEAWFTSAWIIALTGHFCNTFFDSNKNNRDKQYVKYLDEKEH